MAASRLPPGALSLKQFLRRQQVLHLYRKILRAIRDVPAEADRHYLKDWAREEFRRNKDATEEVRSGTRNPERLPSGTIGAVSSLLCDGVLFCRCHFWTGKKSPITNFS
uniref:LYR motif-containing protein 2 n=1 Tax=Aquila chrysaetos chrysaetos TaxID=223781 RepID=A0A663DVK9_AQUCH